VNVLVFNLGMDAAHSTLGHTTAWTNELARRCDHVSVIAMFAGQLAVDDNVTVHSLGKEVGRSEPRRLFEFYRLVRHVLNERHIDACFAHMAPLFTVLFAPVARRHGIPVLLWYAHRSVTPTLRVAHALADRCVTANSASFPLPSDKLFVLGHGIDTEKFRPPDETVASYETTAVAVGRITRIKGLQEMIEAVAILENERGVSLRLELVGGPSTSTDHEYLAALKRSVASLGMHHLVSFRGAVPFYEMPPSYHRGMLSLNLSATALDKAILESMASGCIPVSRNPAFRALAHAQGLDWLVPAPGPHGLADCIESALHNGRERRPALVARLRRIVTEEHSLSTLSDRIIAHLSELAQSSRRGTSDATMRHAT
jgi:glycosyltransferase involved in cell wall biosynthesis